MKNLKLLIFLFTISLAFASCKKEGCTDKVADNYDEEAKEDDGTCEYSGCTDPESLTYNAQATIDDGTCEYAGCMDPDAKNYDAEAVESDGSCLYEGSVVFWWTQTTSQSMINQNITKLDLYLEDNLISTYNTNDYWNSAPLCTESDIITYTRNLGPAKLIEATYRLEDPNSGQAIYSGTISYNANSCESRELIR